jgi:hypothetical protein
MVDGKLVVKDFLEIGADIPETEVKALKRLKLRCYTRG